MCLKFKNDADETVVRSSGFSHRLYEEKKKDREEEDKKNLSVVLSASVLLM